MITLVILSSVLSSVIAASLENPEPEKMKIQVEAQSRDYTTGPVDNDYMLSNRDQILLSLEDPGEGQIWQWAVVSGVDQHCDLSRVYGRGQSASVICIGQEGVYYAYAEKVAVSSLPSADQDGLLPYLQNATICYKEDPCLNKFMLISDTMLTNGSAEIEEKLKNCKVKSDPIKIMSTQYCFLWAYHLKVVGKVGYVSSEPDPSGNEGSYIKYKVYMWITEANSMSEQELRHALPQTKYAGLLTRGFNGKGLEPCIRFAHQAIILLHNTPTFVLDPVGEGIFWTQEFIARTDTIASTLSDISFTIASRQHIALYGCFVAETRVLLDPRQFSFLSAGRNDPQKINTASSDLSSVQRQFVEKQLKHVFGQYVQFVGKPWDGEAAERRRDVQIFKNPCMTLEFGFAVRGVAYMAQDWLRAGSDDITQISLPTFVDDDHVDDNTTSSAQEYIKVYDFVFTPTHMVALLSDSSIFLHPTSTTYKGFGYIRSLQFYRPGALVSRRWCASTVTPKEHNMIVPVFNLNGNLVVIQIIPVEPTTSMWMPKPTASCLMQKKSAAEDQSEVEDENSEEFLQEQKAKLKKQKDEMEFCIHYKEAPKSKSKFSDDTQELESKIEKCEKLLPSNGDSEKEEDIDSLKSYWLVGDHLIDKDDPHFLNDLSDESAFMAPSSTTANFNSHRTYEIDKQGKRMKDMFNDHGLSIHSEVRAASHRDLLWLHDVQFEAEERRFLLAIEIKSDFLNHTEFSMAVLNTVIRNEPIRVEHVSGREVVEADFLFSGVLIVQEGSPKLTRMVGDVKTFTTNTALGNYVIHVHRRNNDKVEDAILYATFDGSHARPLNYYNEPPVQGVTQIPRVRFTGQHPADTTAVGKLKPDLTMTEHGIISVLLRKANNSDSDDQVEPQDNYPQSIIIGSIIVTEPLRKIYPFKGSSYIFQRVTADGEIIYGNYGFRNWNNNSAGNQTEKLGDFYPNLIDVGITRFLSTPFDSMLGGNDDVDKSESEDEDPETTSADWDICPFSDFVVHYIPFDFAEVEYRTRITAEVVYKGSTIPLEADLLVEFDDSHGISVDIRSGIQSSRDQTVVRKTVEIYTFLTPSALEAMYNYEGDSVREDIKIFSVTMRPSIVNLHCRKDLFFKTIQINVGCNPFTTMRFIAEAVGLQPIQFQRSSSEKSRQNHWTVTYNGDDVDVTIPGTKTNFAQRGLLDCVQDNSKQGYCKIPQEYSRLFRENLYQLHFEKSVVPKFEQFLTRHVRRVTGNVFLFNILGGDITPNTTLLDSQCHNLGPSCPPNDDSCGALVDFSETEEKLDQPWTTTFFEHVQAGELDYRADLYKYYQDCFGNTRMSKDNEPVHLNQDLPDKMRSQTYWIFNHTNFNSFKLTKHRNMIFIMRAVVLNTPQNSFTFCQRLETYFLIQLTGVSPARHPLSWYFYLAIITLVLFIFIIIYFVFAQSRLWQSQVSARRIREEEDKEERENEAKQNQEKEETYAQWARKLRDVAQARGKGKVVPEAMFDKPETD